MAAGKYDIVIDQGADYSASIDVTDADGDAVDLTGHTGKGQIRKTYSSSTAVNFDPAIVQSATNGTVRIGLSSTTTNNMKAGRYVYDVEIDNGSAITRIVEGQLEVRPGVTRA